MVNSVFLLCLLLIYPFNDLIAEPSTFSVPMLNDSLCSFLQMMSL